ncbi:MAG: metallophosphoesterase [Hungatella sp.]|jgi:UDP-2,3-diacylglucosamine pyrophosphatase LpxH|nr:metallophosphoesterase [Hungatella sp.]
MSKQYFENLPECKKTIIISDTHLGIDDRFSWTVKNRPRLVSFLDNVASMPDVKELVLNGDLFDEWILPADYPAYTDSDEFYRKAARNNQIVVDAVNHIIQAGKTKVTYIPGNHDMLFSPDIADEIFPGIYQARDARGAGRYKIGCQNEILIEHGHRYDMINAPNQVSNKFITGSYPSILPQGYILARMAVTSAAEGYSILQEPDRCNKDQYNAYLYYKDWAVAFGLLPLNDGFNSKILPITIDGYNGYYSAADITPTLKNGEITAYLYPNFQRDWAEIQQINEVCVPIPFCKEAKAEVNDIVSLVDDQAYNQYFQTNKTIDIVVFGHTHDAKKVLYECKGKAKIYANSGTWIDVNADSYTTANFVMISHCGSNNYVDVFVYEQDGSITKIKTEKAAQVPMC